VFANDDVRSLSRQYFVANSFDGTLTSIVVVGAYPSGIESSMAIVGIGLGAALGLGTWGVWEIERAKPSRERKHLEAAMLTDLEDTQLTQDLRRAQIVHALVAAVGPVTGIALTFLSLAFAGIRMGLAEIVVATIRIFLSR